MPEASTASLRVLWMERILLASIFIVFVGLVLVSFFMMPHEVSWTLHGVNRYFNYFLTPSFSIASMTLSYRSW